MQEPSESSIFVSTKDRKSVGGMHLRNKLYKSRRVPEKGRYANKVDKRKMVKP